MNATVNITTHFKNDVTQLENSYFDTPFKIMNITEDKKANKLNLMLMCNSPGVLDEDEYNFKILVKEKSNLQLFTQSYQRLFDMKNGASQTIEVIIEDNATFTYLPHPCVPHKNAIYKVHNKIFLGKKATLTWGEIITCGRSLHEEIFAFSSLHNCTEIYYNNKLIIKENLLMQPSLIHPNAMGQLEGYTHQASFIFWKEDYDIKLLSDVLYEWYNAYYTIPFGITIVATCGLLIRIVGFKAEELMTCVKEIHQFICQALSTEKFSFSK